MTKIHINHMSKDFDLLMEQLRYAGIIGSVHEHDDESVSFDLYPPKTGVVSVWADMNTRRMRSFNIHASIEKTK